MHVHKSHITCAPWDSSVLISANKDNHGMPSRCAHRAASPTSRYYPSRQPTAVGKAPADFAGAAAMLRKPLPRHSVILSATANSVLWKWTEVFLCLRTISSLTEGADNRRLFIKQLPSLKKRQTILLLVLASAVFREALMWAFRNKEEWWGIAPLLSETTTASVPFSFSESKGLHHPDSLLTCDQASALRAATVWRQDSDPQADHFAQWSPQLISGQSAPFASARPQTSAEGQGEEEIIYANQADLVLDLFSTTQTGRWSVQICNSFCSQDHPFSCLWTETKHKAIPFWLSPGRITARFLLTDCFPWWTQELKEQWTHQLSTPSKLIQLNSKSSTHAILIYHSSSILTQENTHF